MKHGEDKSRQLNKHNLMIFSGEAGDSVQFAEYVQKNIQLYGIKNGVPLATKAISHFVRRELADALRTRVGIFFCLYYYRLDAPYRLLNDGHFTKLS